ncbi:hypothetical protein IFR05_016439 [Cadophora sp. M221]|nr:hypothetical protein IFR05_016439 [Cadophora sp. M221]
MTRNLRQRKGGYTGAMGNGVDSEVELNSALRDMGADSDILAMDMSSSKRVRTTETSSITIDLYTRVELDKFLNKHGFQLTVDDGGIPTFKITVDKICERAFAKHLT